MKIDQELLKACTINSWSIAPRMMLVDSMIESGCSEFKAMEAFEPPTISRHLPKTYRVINGFGDGLGNSVGYGRGGFGDCIGGGGRGNGLSVGNGGGSSSVHGDGSGRYDGGVLQIWNNND